VALDCSVAQELRTWFAPTASTTACWRWGWLAMALAEKRGFKEEDLPICILAANWVSVWQVESLMHSGRLYRRSRRKPECRMYL